MSMGGFADIRAAVHAARLAEKSAIDDMGRESGCAQAVYEAVELLYKALSLYNAP